MKPNFKEIDIKTDSFADKTKVADWTEKNEFKPDWLTAEQIPVKPVYTKEDLEGMEHLNYAAGVPPFLRGPYSTMYAMRPWTIRQYAEIGRAHV